MFEFVLLVQLAVGEPVLEIPVHDCKEGITWVEQASKWAERSRMTPESGPVYACRPVVVRMAAR